MATDKEPEDLEPAVYQVEELTLNEIGVQLIELAERLESAGHQLKGRLAFKPLPNTIYMKNEYEEMTEEEVADEVNATKAAFRTALRGMRRFRREYDRLERLTAEYALSEMEYTQRDAAKELGVAASTINRWAQHPLKIEDYRNGA